MNETSRSLRRLCYLLDPDGLTDGQLLQRFRAHQNEAAFEVLMRRHAPMVLGVCRRILRNHHDAEDAFQATFLVLARKSAAVAPVEMVANWLYGVAYRTARKAKAQAVKIQLREKSMAVLPERSDLAPASVSDLQIMLDQELNRLPDKYRAPLVLCELEGRTHKEASRQLGWPEGTFSVRHMRAKKILANRLARRILGAAGGTLSALITTNAASANVSPALLAATAKSASSFAAGGTAAAGVVPVKALALAEGMLKTMFLTKMKSLMTMFVVIGFLGTGAAYSTQLVTHGPERATAVDPPRLVAQALPTPRNDRANPQAARMDATTNVPHGALARIGNPAFRTSQVRFSAMAPDGRSLYVGTAKGISIYDLDTGLTVKGFRGPDTGLTVKGFPGIATPVFKDAFALSADGTLAASGELRGSFLWHAKSGEQIRKFEARWNRSATFSPDGKKLAVENDGAIFRGIRILDVASGKEEYRLADDQERISQVLFTPDSETLITASQKESSIYVTALRSKKRMHSLGADGAFDPLVALSPDGKTLAVAERRGSNRFQGAAGLRLVDLASGQSRAVDIRGATMILPSALLYSPDGRALVMALPDRTTRLLDVNTAAIIRHVPCGSDKMHITPDSQRLVVVDDCLIRVWDLASGRELYAPEGPTAPAQYLALSPSGAVLAGWSDNSPIHCWNTATGQLLASLDTQERSRYAKSPKSVCFTPDGRLISSNNNGTIRVWDGTTFAESARFEVPDLGKGDLSVASDGRTLACFAYPPPKLSQIIVRVANEEIDAKVRLFAWDLASGKLLHKNAYPPTNRDVHISSLGRALNKNLPLLSPSAKAYIDRSEAGIFVKDMLTDKELVKLKPNPQPNGPDTLDANFLQGPASFSTNGQVAAFAVAQLRKLKEFATTRDHQVVIFDMATGQERFRTPVGAGLHPPSFALAPDGRRLACTVRNSARIWDSVTGKILWDAPEAAGEVTAFAFSADGNRLVTALDDTTMLIWDVSATNR